MKKVGDYVVYRRDVAKIVNIKKNPRNNMDYYVLVPASDESLKIDVPVDNSYVRDLITEKEICDLIKKIPSIPVIENTNKLIENDYKELLKEGSYEGLIKIIKTTYLRNKERIENKKKKGDKDEYYFNLAENYLYTEFSIVLGKTLDETRDYIISEVENNVC